MSLRWFQSLLYSKLTILESSEAYFMNNPWPKELQHFWWCGRHWEGNRKRKGNRRWGTRAKSWGKNSRKFEGLYEVPWCGAGRSLLKIWPGIKRTGTSHMIDRLKIPVWGFKFDPHWGIMKDVEQGHDYNNILCILCLCDYNNSSCIPCLSL